MRTFVNHEAITSNYSSPKAKYDSTMRFYRLRDSLWDFVTGVRLYDWGAVLSKTDLHTNKAVKENPYLRHRTCPTPHSWSLERSSCASRSPSVEQKHALNKVSTVTEASHTCSGKSFALCKCPSFLPFHTWSAGVDGWRDSRSSGWCYKTQQKKKRMDAKRCFCHDR